MIARSRPAGPTTKLSASLILTPREQKQYRRYQSQTSTLAPKNQGRLPNAVEYADFQSWLAKRDSGYLSDTPLADIAHFAERASQKSEENGKASICGHTLHPAHKYKAERCPVCTVEVHITYMKILTVALEAAGGLVKQRWEACDQDCPALQAWYAGKLAVIKELDQLEALALAERAYGSRSSSQATGEIKTATEALEMYWDSMEAKPNMMHSPRQKKVSAVVFCPETCFERGRDQLYFWRKSPRYEAGGKYSSSNEDDEEEDEKEGEESRISVSSSGKAIPLGHGLDNDGDEPDDEASDLEDEDDSDEEEDEEEDQEADVEVEVEVDVDSSFVVFEYEEVAIPGAEFIVFED